jgi:hypothetical protein
MQSLSWVRLCAPWGCWQGFLEADGVSCCAAVHAIDVNWVGEEVFSQECCWDGMSCCWNDMSTAATHAECDLV